MRTFLTSLLVVLLATLAVAQTAPAGNLETVLNSMDKAADAFKSVQADFVWDQYAQIVNEHTIEKGTIYFRRTPKGIDMAANIPQPENERKYVLFTDGKLDLYQPHIDQVTEYSAGKNRETFESMLVLGFGGRGHDLLKSFDVKFAGNEKVGEVNTAKLELVPKSKRIAGMFSQIFLWIDTTSGMSVQQQFMEAGGSGDYRLAKYSGIKIKQPAPNDVFKLKTTGSTRWVRPQG